MAGLVWASHAFASLGQRRRGWPALCHGCLARFLSPERNVLLYQPHSIHSTRFPTFGDVTGTEQINAVQPHNSVFHWL